MEWRDALTAAIATVVAAAIVFFGLVIVTARTADATWKPEYGEQPQAVQQWFHEAELTPAAKQRFPFTRCCEQAERLMTKFVAGDKADGWSYYPDPQCTHAGCKLLPIPGDIVHDEAIHALKPEDDQLPQFKAMRAEGVLMIYQGQPTCFWPPDGGI